MITESLVNEVATYFGLIGLNPGMYETKKHDGVHTINVKRYWLASVTEFTLHSRQFRLIVHNDEPQKLVVCVLQSDENYYGLILIPPLIEAETREFGGPTPLHPIKLDNWKDTVGSSLQSLDLYPQQTRVRTGTYYYQFDIRFAVGNVCSGQLKIKGPSFNDKLDRLANQLRLTIDHLVNQYDDIEMKQYIGLLP